jgi:hypothetical protein
MKVLNVIATAYRATLEEQDDTVLWLTHALKSAGADLDVLLRANAVNYVVKAQDIGRLAFGERVQKQGPRLAEDVAGLIAKEIDVYIVAEDLADRGLATDELIDGLKEVSRDDITALFDDYDHIWHW